jgi:hypothetical protein
MKFRSAILALLLTVPFAAPAMAQTADAPATASSSGPIAPDRGVSSSSGPIAPDTGINREAPKLRPPLLLVEGQVGMGITIGGGTHGPSVVRAAPVTMTLTLDYAIRYKPWISVYGGIRGEAWNRAGLGGLVGLRVRPARGAFRVGTAFVAMLWPYSIAGIAGHAGFCPKVAGTFHLCADGEVTAFVFGGDLPQGRVAAQLSFMLGGAFDAL